jgi:hypothetical protein
MIVHSDLLYQPSLWLLCPSNTQGAIFGVILVDNLIVDTQIGERLHAKISTNKGSSVEILVGPYFGLCSRWDLRLF